MSDFPEYVTSVYPDRVHSIPPGFVFAGKVARDIQIGDCFLFDGEVLVIEDIFHFCVHLGLLVSQGRRVISIPKDAQLLVVSK